MSKLWKIVRNWRKVAGLIEVIKVAAKDRKVTGLEAEAVVKEAVSILVEMEIIDAE